MVIEIFFFFLDTNFSLNRSVLNFGFALKINIFIWRSSKPIYNH